MQEDLSFYRCKEVKHRVKHEVGKKHGLCLTDILSLLEQGFSQKQIAQHFNCSKANITYHLKKARQNGLIQENFRTTGKVEYFIENKPVKQSHIGGVTLPNRSDKIALHHIDFRFKIIKDRDKFVLSDKILLKHGTSYETKTLSNGITLRKYHNGSLIIQNIKVTADNYTSAVLQANSVAIDVKKYLEKRFGIVLSKIPEITRKPHVVPKLHPNLQKEVQETAREFKIEKPDGFTIDQSDGVGKGHMEYKLGGLKTEKERKNAVKKAELLSNMPEMLSFLLEQQVTFSMNLKLHLEVLTDIKEAIKELRNEIKK